MKPIRILHMIGSLNSGGSQAFVMNIYKNIDRSKVQFDFIIDRANETFYVKEIQDLGGKVYTLKSINECNLIAFCKQWNVFFEDHSEYKIIHGHVRSIASIYLEIAKRHGLVTIAHGHSTSSGKGISALIKNIMQYPLRHIADYLFACSQEAGEWLFGKKACNLRKFFIVKNVINTSDFTFSQVARERIRKELNIQDKFVIGHVGRFNEAKNHEFLIKLFYELIKYKPDAVLLLVGDGKLRGNIETLISENQLSNHVLMTGARSDIPELLDSMDVLVFPSLWEGLPVSVVEAQASGLKCIISDGITDEVCISPYIKKISLSIPLEKWIEEIINVQHQNRVDAGKYIIDSGFDIENTVKEITEFYQKITVDR